MTINAAITVNPATLPNGTVGVAYSQTVSATGGTGSYTFSVSAGSLPAGLSLNAATGAITGTPTTAATSNFTITATDGLGATGARAYAVTINAAITVNPATLPNGSVGIAYSQTVSATGGNGSYTFSVSAGTLPAGLSLNAGTGLISGTPTTAATSNFTVTATDGIGATGARAYSVTINAGVAVNPATLPNGTVGVAYSQTISATGGNGSYTFSVSAGSLPAGLSLNAATGAITGTPTTAATSNFTITATDGLGATGSQAYAVTINAAITVNPATLPNGTVGTAYSQTVSATGGNGSYTFSVSAGSLPAGLSLNAATGAITGTPTTAATSNFTITATDGLGATGARAYTVTINAAITVNPATLPNGTVGVAYSQSVSATGGNGSYTFSVSAGSLPAGLSLNAATGAITGTPTTAATSNFTITATDGLGATGARAYAVTVNAAITVNPATLPNGTVGTAYSQTVSATGGNGSYTFSVSAGSLPAGLSLNAATGAITGTPTTAATSNFTITATDGLGATGARAYSVTMNAGVAVNPATLPNGTVGVAYSQTVSATGGNGSYTFSVSAGSLPAGLSLNAASGAITGTPTTAATSNFTITATDGLGATGARAYTVTINAAITVNPATLPNGTVGVAYSQTVSATGGNGSYTFSVSAGSLPAGLSLNGATGAITGTPTTTATSNFTITATDGLGAAGSRAYAVTINAAITVNPATLPSGTVGIAYSQSASATGGNGAYTFSVSAGSLPAGLSLNAATGAITGTPTTAATSNFTITATDGLGATGARAYSVTVNPAITVNPATLTNGTVGVAYSQTVSATGGNGSYTFSVSAGSLPAGLSLNAATGAITGTPTTAATSNFTITATDGLGATGARAYSVTINAAITVNPATLPNGTLGTAYAQTVSATGGNGSYTFSVSAGSLPAGLSLNAATGAISGTPTTTATSNFTVTATDGLAATGARAYSVTINAAITVNPATLPTAMLGAAYSQTVTATGGTGSYVFSVSAGSLPAGLTLNAATGVISGTPTTAATSNFTITATDGGGATGQRAVAFTVAATLAIAPPTLPNGTVGSAYSQTISTTGGTAPYAFTISAGTLPAGLTLNATTGLISGSPTVAGPFTFTVRATDAAGFTVDRAYTVTVVPAALILTSDLGNGRVGSGYNHGISVSGGTAPYAFSVTAGTLPSGLTLNPATGALSGTPTVGGTYTFTITVTDANGASGTLVVTIVIETRPDPTLDPSVRGGNTAQIKAATRFGSAQIANVNSRMLMLHAGHDPCSTDIGISTNIRWEKSEESAADKSATAPASAQDKPAADRRGCDRAFAVWAGGNIDFGFLRPSSAADRSDFRTSGLTLGIDTKVRDDLVLGAALGYGRDSTDVDPSGSQSKGEARNAMLYGSFAPIKAVFIDAMAGYGRLSYDARRWAQTDIVMLAGDRSGSQLFGSLGVSGVLQLKGFTLAPYGRLERVHSRLDSYTEAGSAMSALTYGELMVNDDSIIAGLRGSYDVPLGAMTLTPTLRLEQRRTHSRAADQAVAYADTPTTVYTLKHASNSSDFTTGGIGFLLRMGFVFTVDVEYTYTTGSGTFRTQTTRALLRAAF